MNINSPINPVTASSFGLYFSSDSKRLFICQIASPLLPNLVCKSIIPRKIAVAASIVASSFLPILKVRRATPSRILLSSALVTLIQWLKEAKFVSKEVTLDCPGSSRTVSPCELEPTPIFSAGSYKSKNIFNPLSEETSPRRFFIAADISLVLMSIMLCVQSI